MAFQATLENLIYYSKTWILLILWEIICFNFEASCVLLHPVFVHNSCLLIHSFAQYTIFLFLSPPSAMCLYNFSSSKTGIHLIQKVIKKDIVSTSKINKHPCFLPISVLFPSLSSSRICNFKPKPKCVAFPITLVVFCVLIDNEQTVLIARLTI